MVIERRAQDVQLDGMKAAEIVRKGGGGFAAGFGRNAVNLAAIAGGKNQRFVKNSARAKLFGGLPGLVVGERHALAHLYWR
jgi:hypothetical protein